MRTCPGHTFDSGLLADPCLNCARRGPGGLKPLAEFVELPEWVGWRCLNHVPQERINDQSEVWGLPGTEDADHLTEANHPMSTSDEIMLRAQEAQKRFDALLPRWSDALLLRWWAINCWLSHLQCAAESTRYQLTYTPKP